MIDESGFRRWADRAMSATVLVILAACIAAVLYGAWYEATRGHV